MAFEIDQKKLRWYESWVILEANDAPPRAFLEDPEEIRKAEAEIESAEEKRRQRIRQDKDRDMLPYLKALFWKHYQHPEGGGAAGGVPSIMEALTLCPNVMEADVAGITDEVERLIRLPFHGHGMDKENFLLSSWMMSIALRFPAPENIDRCVRIIRRSDKADWGFPKLHGLNALSRIGSADTLKVAEEVREWMRQKAENTLEGGVAQQQAMFADQLVEKMRQRLATLPPPEIIPPVSLPPPAETIAPSKPPAPPVSADSVVMDLARTTRPHPLWIAPGLLLLPVIFLLLRKKR